MSTNLELSLNQAVDPPRPVIDIRYGEVGLVQVRLHTTVPGAVVDELTGRVAAAPHFFRRTAVCLDLSALDKAPEVGEIRAVIDAVRRVGMLPVGLIGDFAGAEAASNALNLPILSSFRTPNRLAPVIQPAQAATTTAEPAPASQPAPAATSEPAPAPVSEPAPVAEPAPVSEPAPPVASSVPALIHNQAVRSGQRVYARNRDLIVTVGVAVGAEVMADGCLHVYGALRGRAMAGAHGETTARVFCQEFYAELVSIAGVFRVFETIPAELAGKPVQAWLAGEDLHFARLGS